MARFKPHHRITPYPVRMKHNHTVRDRVVAISGSKARLESGAVYALDKLERVPL
jgi:hypothetical protein